MVKAGPIVIDIKLSDESKIWIDRLATICERLERTMPEAKASADRICEAAKRIEEPSE